MSIEKNSISFVVPCFNEENNIKNTIDEICFAASESTVNEYEIIIVNG